MKNSQNENRLVVNDVKNGVWEAAKENAPCFLMDGGKSVRISLDGGKSGFNAQQEIFSQPGSLFFVPDVRLSNVFFR